MAFEFSREVINSSGEGWWYWKEKMVAAGATVKSSSDGTTFGAGDNLDPGGPYAGSFDNTSAWVVIQWPSVAGVVRECCIQLSSTENIFVRCYWSSDGVGFSGGGATTRPTAADEQWTLNAGNDFFSTAANSPGEVFFIVGDVDEGYSWMMLYHLIQEAGGVQAVAFMDVLTEAVTGDPDPAVYGTLGNSGTSGHLGPNGYIYKAVNVTNSVGNPAAWFDKGGPNEDWVSYPLTHAGFSAGFFNSVDRLPFLEWNGEPDGSFLTVPCVYMRGDVLGYTPTGSFGVKGKSRFFRTASERLSEGPGLIVLDRTGNQACIGTVVIPWSPAFPKRLA